MGRLTNSDKEIPTLVDNEEYWLQVYFKLKDYEDLHEQRVEWLEELKALRTTSCGYSKEDIELNRNAMYNKAIDDFADKLKQDVMTITFGLRICDIDRIAEQLKAGD